MSLSRNQGGCATVRLTARKSRPQREGGPHRLPKEDGDRQGRVVGWRRALAWADVRVGPPQGMCPGVRAGSPVPMDLGAQHAGPFCLDQHQCRLWGSAGRHFIPLLALTLTWSLTTALLFTFWSGVVGGVRADPRGIREPAGFVALARPPLTPLMSTRGSLPADVKGRCHLSFE